MTRFLYTLLMRLVGPIFLLWLWVRHRKSRREWEIFSAARFGRYADSPPLFRGESPVWVHAVSLGETRAAQPLLSALLARGLPVLLTHTTPTGKAEGARLFRQEIAQGKLQQAWLLYDFPGATKRFIQHFSPRCGILIEREVWPNLIQASAREGVSVLLVSARFSESSLRRSVWAKRALRRAYAALDLVLAQTAEDAERLRQVGAHGPHVVGNLKFDVKLSQSQIASGLQWRRAAGRPVIAIASTREGEEEMFAQAIADISATSSLKPLHLLVPRHPQRFPEAANVLERHKLPFARRSLGADVPNPNIPVLLGDTLGEMAFYYAAADVAIIGGGFAGFGGQDLIEACAVGTPVILGPDMHNFAQAAKDAVAGGAAIQVSDAQDAVRAAYDLLQDDVRRDAMRQAALTWTTAHSGATERILRALKPWLGPLTNDPQDQGRS